MKNYYSTIDEVVMTFTDIEKNYQGFESITVHFERPSEKGFDFSEWRLPDIVQTKSFGFSEDEVLGQKDYLIRNQFLIWDIAKEGKIA